MNLDLFAFFDKWGQEVILDLSRVEYLQLVDSRNSESEGVEIKIGLASGDYIFAPLRERERLVSAWDDFKDSELTISIDSGEKTETLADYLGN
jgi:hypothetical protein